MGLVIAKTIRVGGKAYGPGDEDAFSEVADKKLIDGLKKRELLVDIPEPKTVKEKPAAKSTAAKKVASEE